MKWTFQNIYLIILALVHFAYIWYMMGKGEPNVAMLIFFMWVLPGALSIMLALEHEKQDPNRL
jgi:hypothetical protein